MFGPTRLFETLPSGSTWGSSPLALWLAEEGGAPAPAFPWQPMLIIGVLFYFLLIAPERKRKREREELLGALKKNDEVMSTGGLYGTVTKVDGEVVTMRISDGVHIRIARGSIQGIVGDPEPAGDDS